MFMTETALPTGEADLVIYGCTSAAVIAAVQARAMGLSVVMVGPDLHLGGMASSGLGYVDAGDQRAIGGLSLAFHKAAYDHYRDPAAWRQEDLDALTRYPSDRGAIWTFEPHVAEAIFEQFVEGVPVYRGEHLRRDGSGVTKCGARLDTIMMESGAVFRGRMFIDATYEGDLMAEGGVSFTVGREANAQYGETLNGVQTANAVSHQFDLPISPYRIPGDPASGLLPGVHDGDPGRDGEGDDRVQAYNFRMCLTDEPANRVPFPKPANYDPLRYELLARYLDAGWPELFDKFDRIPNRKTDTNNHGAMSTDHIGANYDYPTASHERRLEIVADHRDYQLGLMWFLANDPRTPASVREAFGRFGLCRDEFADNGHWPHQIYVREARRMVSDFVMTEHHVRGTRSTPRPIGMGSYNIDSHNTQRYVDADGHARNEGDIQVPPGGPYSIDLGAILPRREEAENLLVPVALSASHAAYGSIRMEPVFMILGQSAATVAALALRSVIAVQDVDYGELRDRLLLDGQVLTPEGMF